VLVVIDTLSRCSGGADENSNTEMARVIAAADQVQQRFHCTVLIVHHAGKDRERGPRGASSLIGNTEPSSRSLLPARLRGHLLQAKGRREV